MEGTLEVPVVVSATTQGASGGVDGLFLLAILGAIFVVGLLFFAVWSKTSAIEIKRYVDEKDRTAAWREYVQDELKLRKAP